MGPINQFAITAAKEIVVAKMTSSTVKADKESGKDAADFFEEVYSRILSLSSNSH